MRDRPRHLHCTGIARRSPDLEIRYKITPLNDINIGLRILSTHAEKLKRAK